MSIISHSSKPSKPHTILPVFSLLFASTMWGIYWYPLRIMADMGLSGAWLSLLIYGGAMILGLPLLWRHRSNFLQHPGLLFAIAVTTGFCNLAFILAVLDGHVVRVILLFYLSPVWAALLGWWLLGEQLHRQWWVVAIAMSGALIMLWSPELGMPWPQDKSDWLALSSGINFALSNTLIRKLDKVSIRVKAATGWLGVVLVAAIVILVMPAQSIVFTMNNVLFALAAGMLGMTLMTLAVVYGVTHMPVSKSSVILLFEIVVGAVSAVWLAGEVISNNEWLGGSLVMLAGYLSARLHLKEETSG